MPDYEKLMERCIELAKQGRGNVSPNPLVGCVVLDKNDNIVSEGYHHKYGDNHAERDALLKLKNGEEQEGTLIVNLEPCSHWGKTPPCADLIIERGLKTVVIGCADSNPKVAGSGIKKLKENGINVIIGIKEAESRALNEIFFCDKEKNRTFTALKTATTIDGKIAAANGDSKWITSAQARNYGKILRGYYDSILTSSATVIADNPEMKHKSKIILDKDLRTDFNSKIFKTGKIILVTLKEPDIIPDNVSLLKPVITNGEINLTDLMKKLYDKGIKSVFIECGGTLAGSFIKEGLIDKLYHFIAPKILNDNSGLSCFNGDRVSKISDTKEFILDQTLKLGSDLLVIYNR